MDRTCPKCQKTFPKPYVLKQHLARKTPCAPIVDQSELSAVARAKAHICRYCGRTFTSLQGVSRHIRQNCKIANTDQGMDTLLEHTLKKQLAAQDAKIDRLTALVEKLTLPNSLAVRAAPVTTNNISTIHNGPVTHLTQVNTVVNVKSFDGDDRIYIPVELVKAAFTENPRLIEYCRLSDDDRVDAEKAAPYVLEALVDLVRRAHRDPVYRNVHLNPKRADQVMVCVGEDQRWEVRSLVDVIRVLFDGVADNLHRLIITDRERSQLPFDVQSAASWVPNLYEDEPERFVKEGRTPMAAHLANAAPGRILPIPALSEPK